MKFHSLFILFFLILCASSNYGLINSPGAQIRLTMETLKNALESMIKVINKRSHSLPDFPNTKVNLSFWPFPLWVRLYELHDENINFFERHLEVLENGNINITFYDTEIHIRGMCKLHQSHFPAWDGTFHMKVDLKFDYVSMIFKIINNGGYPEIEVVQSENRIGDLSIDFDGGDLGRQIANALGKLFNNELKELLQDQIKKNLYMLGTSMTATLKTIPIVFELSGSIKDFSVTYQLFADARVSTSGSKKDLIIPIVNQIWYKGHKDDSEMKNYVFPSGPSPDYASPQDVCVDVDSNLLFGTAAYGFNRSELSNRIVIGDEDFWHLKPKKRSFFSCDCLGDMCFTSTFKELKNRCNTGLTVIIGVTAQVLSTRLNVNTTAAYFLINFHNQFKLVQANGNESPLIEMDMDVWVKIEKTVDVKNMTAFTNFSLPLLKDITASSIYMSNISRELLQKFWDDILQDVFTIKVNKIISSGLSMPQVYFADFSNYQIKNIGPFMQLCSDIVWDFSKLFPTSRTPMKKSRRKISRIRYVYVPFYVPYNTGCS